MFELFGEFVDIDPSRHFVKILKMSLPGSIQAVRKIATIQTTIQLMIYFQKIIQHRGHLSQGETPCESRTLGTRHPIR